MVYECVYVLNGSLKFSGLTKNLNLLSYSFFTLIIILLLSNVKCIISMNCAVFGGKTIIDTWRDFYFLK